MAKWSVLEGAGGGGGGRRGKGRGDPEQLDLFAGLGSGMKLSDSPARPEPEHVRMVLPQDPPDVAGEVRGIFGGGDDGDDNGAWGEEWNSQADAAGGVPPGGRVEYGRAGAPTEGRPLPPTGVFRRPVAPQQEELPLEEGPEDDGPDAGEEPGNALPWGMRLRAWAAGVEWNGRLAIGVGVALIVAMALGIGSARGCGGGGEAAEIPPPEEEQNLQVVAPEEGETAALGAPENPGNPEKPEIPENPGGGAAEERTQQVASLPALPEWTISGAKVSGAGGAWTVTFEVPLFESGAYISKAGMPVLKALAAKLKGLEGGTVLVTGYTDNVPLTRPTKEFNSNADVAAARAQVAAEHLRAFAKNGKLDFLTAAGAESEAPWPNDTPEHRRLNRTAVVKIIPAGP